MHILFVTPQLPEPPRQGTQIRNFHLIKAAASVHEVDLLSFARSDERIEEAGALRELCNRVHLVPVPLRTAAGRLLTMLGSPDPDIAHRLSAPDLASSLHHIVADGHYDAVQIEGLEMASYIPVVRAAAPATAVVFDDHNVEYLLQRRAAQVDAREVRSWPKAAYSLVQCRKLKRYEREVCRSAEAVLAVSEADAEVLRRLARPRRLQVVPNGVDTDFYRTGHRRETESGSMLFTGTMDYRPNVDAVRWFAGRVLPRIVARRPEAVFRIVGHSPSPTVRALASDHVEVVGPVDDVRPFFEKAAVFVVPIRIAGGARLKLMEALAMGVPIVSTSVGAEGIGVADGEELFLADDASGFAAAVLRLFADPELAGRIARAGRVAAEQRFDWRQVAPKLLELYGEIAG